MNAFHRIALASLVAACSVASSMALAQPQTGFAGPLTRAQVRQDLIDWRQAGFNPLDWIRYPENAQRAGAIVAQRRAERAAGQIPQ
jgi:hypothetical protein